MTLQPIIKTNYFWTTAIGKIVREQRLCVTANKELFPPKLPKPSNKNFLYFRFSKKMLDNNCLGRSCFNIITIGHSPKSSAKKNNVNRRISSLVSSHIKTTIPWHFYIYLDGIVYLRWYATISSYGGSNHLSHCSCASGNCQKYNPTKPDTMKW